ncbi:MAG: molybdate ABC transporter permease subunit [Planctomycetes bacterium]|nr:molybdate ABC transporter permease subunit [Planctomycetota bacterium]
MHLSDRGAPCRRQLRVRRGLRRVHRFGGRASDPSRLRVRRTVTAARRVLPAVLIAPVALAGLFLSLPLVGLLLRAPWGRLLAVVADDAVRAALLLSVQCSLAAAALCLVFGLPLATWLAAGGGRLRVAVRVLVTLPMVLPPVVAGVALLLAYGRNGIVGAPLDDWLGIALPFRIGAVIVAETYVALPFFVLTVEGGLRALDGRYADAAATLGAGPWRVFRTVTLPMIAPSLRAGLLVAWARALGEFGATITFAGSLAGVTRTLPLAVYAALDRGPEAAIALSLLLVLVSIGVLVLLRKQWWPGR